MKNIGVLFGINEKNLKLDIYKEKNEEFVIIENTRIPIRLLNMREFEKYEIIEKN